MSDTTLSKRQQVWLDHIRAAESRGMTLAAYAAEVGVRPADLYNWKSKFVKRGVLKARNKAEDFAAVRLPSESDAASCTVHFANGVRVEFNAPMSAQQLEVVLTRAARLP